MSQYATLARAVAAGRSSATVQVACPGGGPFPVRHAVDADGSALLLTRVGSAVDTALTSSAADTALTSSAADTALTSSAADAALTSQPDDVAAVLAVTAASGGRLWLSGWSSPLVAPDEVRAAADAFAARSPVGELLDVGRGWRLHRLAVAEVRVQDAHGRLVEVDPEEYAAAI